MNMENKKGEITTKQLVTIIILIVSFAIILFLLFRLNLGRTSDKEICHNSVVLKSTGKGLVGRLDCRINYLCISGGGKCEGINPTTTVKVNANNKEEIMKAIADEMADCWWMFGEGGLAYIGAFEGGVFQEKTVCAICSIIKFDEKIQEAQEKGITYEEFLNNLTRLKDNSGSYLHYLYDVYTVEDLLNKFKVIKEDYEAKRPIPFDRTYVIRTGQSTDSKIIGLFKAGGRIIIGGIKEITGLEGGKETEVDVGIIVTYFFDNKRTVEPSCDEFVTKA